MDEPRWLRELDPNQRAAALHDGGPLLVLAGAGSGKTRTLVARVARLVADGTPAHRILLLTFTRRAAREMIARARTVTGDDRLRQVRGGTFHSVAHRLLQQEGRGLGLHPGFSVLDEGDAADLVELVRRELALAEDGPRFPRRETIVAIASRVAGSQQPLSRVLERDFPWVLPHAEAIRQVLLAVRDRKRATNAVDFDDLLLYWHALLRDEGTRVRLAAEYDHVLVDEFQDVNVAQAEIARLLTADHGHLTVVGDDAQAIYGFRGATVAGIREFPQRHPGTTIVTLDRSYRCVQPILDCANRLMADAPDAYAKRLVAARPAGARPRLVTCDDEARQSASVCDAILDLRERGVPLREQAVLFRTAHHAAGLEVELSRRDIPFVKYGGLKFLDTAHLKDALACLRLLDNPADELAWHRVLRLLEGVGPARARALQEALGVGVWRCGDPPEDSPVRRFLGSVPALPAPAQPQARALHDAWATATDASSSGVSVGAQVEALRPFLAAVWPARYADADARLADVERLAALAGAATDRARFVADLALEPPSSTSDLAGRPHPDDDWLTLSTIHSAKGGEWRAVHLIHAADGNIPSDMALRDRESLEEERRLLYVAITRAKDELQITFPLRFHIERFGASDRHGYGQLSRFLARTRDAYDEVALGSGAEDPIVMAGGRQVTEVDTALEDLWAS